LSPCTSIYSESISPQEIANLWTEAKKEETEQYKLKVYSRKLTSRVLAKIDEVPEEQ